MVLAAEQRNGNRSLPSGWRRVRLGDVIAEAKPGFASGVRDPKGVVQLRMNNVDTRGKMVWTEFIRVPVEYSVAIEYQLVPGDLLFNNTNSVELVGKSAPFLGFQEPVVYSNHFTRLRVNPQQLDPQYLAAWLLQQWQLKVFESICNRWIGQSAVKNDKLLALEIPLPPLDEQKRIAAILNEQMAAVERARAAAEAQLEAAKALPAAYLRAVFSSPEAQQWPRRKLEEIAKLQRGRFSPRPRNDPRYYGGPYPWIQIGEVEAANKYITFYRSTLNDHGLAVSKMFPKGTLVISIAATIGAVGILTFDACMPDSLVGITPYPGIGDKEFLYYVLLFIRDHLESIAPQMAQANLKLELLNPLQIPAPPYADQQRVAAMLNEKMASAERTRKAIEKELDTVNKLPAALLRRAFNGEL
jgi:type I restriction enzyme S subunit